MQRTCIEYEKKMVQKVTGKRTRVCKKDWVTYWGVLQFVPLTFKNIWLLYVPRGVLFKILRSPTVSINVQEQQLSFSYKALLVEFYNLEGVCLLCGTSWNLKNNSV